MHTEPFEKRNSELKNIYAYSSLGRANLLSWHRLAVGTRKEQGASEELKWLKHGLILSRVEGFKAIAKPACAPKAAIPVMLCANICLSSFVYFPALVIHNHHFLSRALLLLIFL